jgi:tetratricopeptide (TPR) repeat protein
MKLRAGLVALVLAATAASAEVPSATGQDDPCAGPKALEAAGDLKAAQQAYSKLLLARPELKCAQIGLAAIIKPADASKEAKALCDQGAAYRRTGRHKEAETAYKKAIEKDPSKGSCGEKGLDAVDHTVGGVIDSVIAVFTDVLIALGSLLVVGLVLLMLGYREAVFRVYRRLPIARTILRPRLTLADLGDPSDDVKAGAALTARIRERLNRFREEANDEDKFADNLDFGKSNQELADIVAGDSGLQSSLDKLGEVGGQAKVVAAIIGLLVRVLPIRRFAFTGVIEPVAGPSASATMSLQAGDRLAGAVTLTGRDLVAEPKAGDYLALAPTAAVWVQYQVARGLADQDLPLEKAESYALVREGLDLHQRQDLAGAVSAFEEALALDSRNWAARVNLALSRARLENAYDDSVLMLEEALEDLRNAYYDPTAP